MLGVVIIVGRVTGGAMLNVAIGGFTLQPSELVKIIFVFFVAASLKDDTSFKNIVITTAVATMHVLILVVSKRPWCGADHLCCISDDALCGKQTATLCNCRTDCRKWGISCGI